MREAKAIYKNWTEDTRFDEATRLELQEISNDPVEIEERFYQDLQFGTAGLRGIIGAGTNRMNVYTVARAADGFARYLVESGPEACARGVAISYDSRRFSPEFAELTARIFVTHGIRVLLSNELRPVPMLSFAVRHYNCAGGVMITASHNPKQYNGFKAYGEDGGQMPPEAADIVSARMAEEHDLPAILERTLPLEAAQQSDLWQEIGDDLDEAYTEMLLKLSINPDAVKRHRDLKIVYSPLHGSGNKPVRRVLKRLGFENIIVVPEQEQPDPDFTTVMFPNPEERSALQLAIDLAERENADLVIATDPDADRTGVCVRTRDGTYLVLSGNQIGLLLMEYILAAKHKAGKLPPKSFVVTTIVSSKLTKRIAAHYGVELMECLTGFKFIAELIKAHDEFGDGHFQFGFEESYGYLAGRDVRDKDAVVASMLLAEMAAVAADDNQTLNDRLQAIYEKYGHAAEKMVSITREGKVGLEMIRDAMSSLRLKKMDGIPGVEVKAVRDYLELTRLDLATGRSEPLDSTPSNVLIYELDGLDWFGVRPSGTEPKIKIYFGFYRETEAESENLLEQISERVIDAINNLM